MGIEIKDVKYQLHAIEGDSNTVFELSDDDRASSSTQYFGYVDINGRCLIMKKSFSSGITNTRYYYSRTGYTTAWTNRASLDYGYYYELRSDLA